ncbi:MAG: ATP-dependent Clp protease ATP-binding subunit [Patescibacteria group bacterium]|jgi:ATP-dependent Clp protease ATP-binding subunit ClpC|nr:ATP-dependent Clp protease ATP-binding subunit [Patescibacteria group bacterium]
MPEQERINPEDIEFVYDDTRKIYGSWFLGRFLYWNYPVKKSISLLKKFKNRFYKIANILGIIVIISGWLSFAFWIYLNLDKIIANPLNLIFFWQEFDFLILIFLLSLFFDLFFVYRISQKKAETKKIKKKDFNNDEGKNKKEGKRFNIVDACTDEAIELIEEACFLAKDLNLKKANSLHIFRVLLKNKEIQNVFIRLNVDAKKMISLLDRNLAREEYKEEEDNDLEEIMICALVEAYNLGQDNVDPLNIISYCYARDDVLAEILEEVGVNADRIRNTVAWFRINRKLKKKYKKFHSSALLKPEGNMNRSYTAIATPTLDKFSHDLTIQAKFGNLEMCIGREKEFRQIFQSFNGGHNGLLLVGHNGVGKTTIINGLAQIMVEEDVPKFMRDRRLIELDTSILVSGADASLAQERLLACISEASRSGNIVLYIDNVENLIGISAGSQESLDLSEVLAESVRRKHIFAIASASSRNYSSYVERTALGEAMTKISVKEPEKNNAIQILQSKVGQIESKYGVFVVYGALEAAVNMSEKYFHDKYLPLKAINLLQKAASVAASRAANNPEDSFCGKEDVAVAISELTGIPAQKVSEEESQKLLNLEEEIHKRLVGQEEAVKAVSASLRRARAQIKSGNKPIASFLFLGPTGVGKTELAKSVSDIYFGDEDYLVRIDMSEYQGSDSLSKMIGDTSGTKGYLTEAVRKKPFSLILLDEIEKANPDILNLFLQMLDDGRLTDGQGRTVSFSESIIIATSNIGANYIQDEIKKDTDINVITQGLIDDHLNKHMRPELINRFDGIIVFKTLSEEDVTSITTLMLKKIKKNLEKKGFSLKADKRGVKILAKQGYDPKFGARPLRRLLQEKVENVIANKILSGELKRRDIIVINDKAEIEIEKGLQI